MYFVFILEIDAGNRQRFVYIKLPKFLLNYTTTERNEINNSNPHFAEKSVTMQKKIDTRRTHNHLSIWLSDDNQCFQHDMEVGLVVGK